MRYALQAAPQAVRPYRRFGQAFQGRGIALEIRRYVCDDYYSGTSYRCNGGCFFTRYERLGMMIVVLSQRRYG